MANRRMALSGEGKFLLDTVADALDVDRPMAVKIALAKGIANSNKPAQIVSRNGQQKWTIPDGIIKDKEYLLFKHLIINEIGASLNEDDLHKYMLSFIEKGVRILNEELNEKSSMEDPRLSIL